MSASQRRKGAGGELELVHVLRRYGIDARCGLAAAHEPDIVHNLKHFHPECKRVEKLNIHSAMAQAVQDSAANETPCVVHRRNRGTWLATLPLTALLEAITRNDASQLIKKEVEQ
jgi:hypothetical protein